MRQKLFVLLAWLISVSFAINAQKTTEKFESERKTRITELTSHEKEFIQTLGLSVSEYVHLTSSEKSILEEKLRKKKRKQPKKRLKTTSRTKALSEDFEGTSFPPVGWTHYNLGDNTTSTTWTQSSSEAHSGSYSAYCNYGASGEAQDEWLITPLLSVSASENELSFYYQTHGSFAATVDVMISTTDLQTSSFTSILTLGQQGVWDQEVVDLSAYEGQNIYIAFRYQGEWDWYAAIDDVTAPSIYVSQHDLGITEIIPDKLLSGETTTPQVTISNNGQSDEPSWTVQLTDGAGYDQTISDEATILAGEEYTVDFPDWAPADGTYTLQAILSNVTDDEIPFNDTLEVECTVSDDFFMGIPSSTYTITTCSGTIYDDGGPSENYGEFVHHFLTVEPESAGSYTVLDFEEFDISGYSASLRIYDGLDANATLIGEWDETNSPGTITATNANGALTIELEVTSSFTYPGFKANISCYTPVAHDMAVESISPTHVYSGSTVTPTVQIKNNGMETESVWTVNLTDADGYNETISDQQTLANEDIYEITFPGWSPADGTYTLTATISNVTGDAVPENDALSVNCTVSNDLYMGTPSSTYTVTTCSGTIYDDGGPDGNYANSTIQTLTIVPETPGTFTQLTFNEFATEASYDDLYIYDGESESATEIGVYTGATLQGEVITASNPTGALTLKFTPDHSNTDAGFAIDIACYTPPEHDLGVTEITPTSGLTGAPITPQVTLHNYGLSDEDTWSVTLTDGDSYNETISDAATITAATDYTIDFPEWNPEANSYTLIATITNVTGDDNAANDEISVDCEITNEIYMGNPTSSFSVTTCDAILYDNGGPTGDYSSNVTHSVTIFPSTAEAYAELYFEEFDTEEGYDELYIYDGEDENAPLIGEYTGTELQDETITASNATGALTLKFTPDGSVTAPGFIIHISCFTPAPHDLAIKSLSPEWIASGEAFMPEIVVNNRGLENESSWSVNLTDGNAYNETITDPATINSGESYTVNTFPAWTPADGTYTLTATVSLADEGNPDDNTLVQNLEVVNFSYNKDMVYSYNAYDWSGSGLENYIVGVNMDATMTALAPSGVQNINCGDYVGSFDTTKLIGIADSVAYCINGDGSTYEYATIHGITNIKGFTWDKTTNQMFIISNTNDATLYALDENFNATTIGTIITSTTITALAADTSGILYGLGLDDRLYSIDKNTGEGTLVALLDMDVILDQDIGFDRTTNTLYGTLYKTGSTGGLYTIDVSDGSTSQIGVDYQDKLTMCAIYTTETESYSATFTVTDGTNPLQDVTISIDGQSVQTNADGDAIVELQNGSYNYTATLAGYQQHTGTIEIDGADITESITMTEATEFWTVTFNVTDGSTAIDGATVNLSGYGEQITDASGVATFSEMVSDGTYDYTVTATGYLSESGSVTVSGSDISENVTLELAPVPYTVAFNVTDGANAIEGATVALQDHGEQTTDASGYAEFTEAVEDGTYNYTVSANGYLQNTGTITVDGADVTENVTLTEATEFWTVTFTVTDGSNAIEGAAISLQGYGTVTTDASGVATYTDQVSDGTYDYTINASGYLQQTGTITVSGADVDESVEMTEATEFWTVTFTVTNGTNPIEGATVMLENYGEQTTDGSGIAMYDSEVSDGTFNYSVTAPGYEETNGSVTVSGQDLDVDITLDEIGIYSTNNNLFHIYPNPTDGRFTIKADGIYNAFVYNSTGKIVHTQKVTGKSTINLKGHPKGLYFIHLRNEAQILNTKIIIE